MMALNRKAKKPVNELSSVCRIVCAPQTGTVGANART